MSLASGTFVLLVRLFFILAAQVPPAGLRKENGKLKINYTFANGETSDVEVRAACRAPKGERQIENQLHICKW